MNLKSQQNCKPQLLGVEKPGVTISRNLIELSFWKSPYFQLLRNPPMISRDLPRVILPLYQTRVFYITDGLHQSFFKPCQSIPKLFNCNKKFVTCDRPLKSQVKIENCRNVHLSSSIGLGPV